jgi:hypothetical protein
MADVAAVLLTPEVVGAIINLIASLLERESACCQIDYRTNLSNIKLDLDMVKGVLEKTIENRNRRDVPVDAIRNWKEEAQTIVQDADRILRRINGKNPSPDSNQMDDSEKINCCCLRINKTGLHYNCEDARQLRKLKNRLDAITKHNATILQFLALPPPNRCILL